MVDIVFGLHLSEVSSTIEVLTDKSIFMSFTLPSLPYAYDALAPHIDAQTMEIHHTKHHQTYLDKLNDYCAQHDTSAEIADIIASIDADSASVLRNNAGGYHNHMLFWANLSPDATKLSNALEDAVQKTFGSLESCHDALIAAGTGQFGSGWVWLVSDAQGALSVMSTPNQDSPLMSALYGDGHHVLLALDVWEHAYYLAYQNRRPDYLEAIMKVVNWAEVSDRYDNR